MRNLIIIIMMSIFQTCIKHKMLEKHTGVSPEDRLRHCFNGFRSDFSSFYSPNPFYYAKPKWSSLPEM